MAYTPINWQTGDTITADKLNRCDNGWAVQETQLFSETVTTSGEEGLYEGQLAYSYAIDADTITVIYDSTEYTCPSIGEGEYGAPYNDSIPDFSEFPFNLYTRSNEAAYIITQTAGEHTVAVSTSTVQTSSDFDEAASAALGGAFYLVTSGVTTWQEIADAIRAGKVVYRYLYDEANEYAEYELITSAGTDGMGTYQIYYMTVKSNGIYTGTVSAASANSPLWFY